NSISETGLTCQVVKNIRRKYTVTIIFSNFFFTDPAITVIYTLSLHDALPIFDGERLREVTGRDGSFRFNNVPAGEYELVSEYGGALPERVAVTVVAGETAEVSIRIGGGSEQENASQLKGLLIDSQAAGQAAAINRRRRAPSVIDVLSSDSV